MNKFVTSKITLFGENFLVVAITSLVYTRATAQATFEETIFVVANIGRLPIYTTATARAIPLGMGKKSIFSIFYR